MSRSGERQADWRCEKLLRLHLSDLCQLGPKALSPLSGTTVILTAAAALQPLCQPVAKQTA
jgi:hypothetical protein